MSEIQTTNTDLSSGHRKVRQKRSSTHIDMTPMVDLAFLLLTFFIMTTTFKSHKIIDLIMPDNQSTKSPTLLAESKAFNLLIMNDRKLKWYMGAEDKAARALPATFSEGPNSIRKILMQKNKIVNDSVFVLIKPSDNSSYNDLINVFDLMTICNINSYTIMNLNESDKKVIEL
ncbi:MAG: biopolymer transporter ExbD [Bacteroidetes bacterium]|nr:biopolymer transporter ExbD [Bacteroidota bacterium]